MVGVSLRWLGWVWDSWGGCWIVGVGIGSIEGVLDGWDLCRMVG